MAMREFTTRQAYYLAVTRAGLRLQVKREFGAYYDYAVELPRDTLYRGIGTAIFDGEDGAPGGPTYYGVLFDTVDEADDYFESGKFWEPMGCPTGE